jgi:hypothetical protein
VPLSVRTPQARRWYVLYICAIIIENTSSTEMVCIIYMCHYHWEHLKHGDGMYYISVPLSVRTPQAWRWYVLYICHYHWEHLKHRDGMYYIYVPLSLRTPQAQRRYVSAIISESTSCKYIVWTCITDNYPITSKIMNSDGHLKPLNTKKDHDIFRWKSRSRFRTAQKCDGWDQ